MSDHGIEKKCRGGRAHTDLQHYCCFIFVICPHEHASTDGGGYSKDGDSADMARLLGHVPDPGAQACWGATCGLRRQ